MDGDVAASADSSILSPSGGRRRRRASQAEGGQQALVCTAPGGRKEAPGGEREAAGNSFVWVERMLPAPLKHGSKPPPLPRVPISDRREQTEGAPEPAGGQVEDCGRRQREERSAHTRAAEAAGRDGAGERRPAGDHPQPRGGARQPAQDEGGRARGGREVSALPSAHAATEKVSVF